MFSGIVETVGQISSVSGQDSKKIEIETPWKGKIIGKVGDSISVNGVCLTVTEIKVKNFLCEAVPETLRCTNLGELVSSSTVNLERSLRYGDRVGGHFVQGHVDSVGEILEIKEEGDGAWLVTIGCEETLVSSLLDKGFVAIDGMSITVIKARNDFFTVTFIPHTIESTIVKTYKVGSKVNLEPDRLVK